MTVEKFSEFECNLLEALGRFEYLTTIQAQKLGLSPSLHFIQSRVRNLTDRQKPLIGALDFGSIPTIGRLPRLLYLTKDGVDLLAETETTIDPIRYPKNARLFPRDYQHRINTIDVLIAAYTWAHDNDGTMPMCHTYYGQGKQGDKGRALAASHVSWIQDEELANIIPDAVFKTALPDKEFLYCIEVTNGDKWQGDKGKIYSYLKAFDKDAIEDTFNYAHAVRLIFIYEKERAMVNFIEWAKTIKELQPYKGRLFVASHKQIKENGFINTLLEI